ncbi:hypothetical protein G9A89_007460 [Geosiphon pyriformis]|nr:hypothetical protein G9A89_007460 [Geosiphon pyriformis]
MATTTTARDIPAVKRAESGAAHPTHYSTTPAGTIYSSTPGGSRIIYDRNTLLNLANSPLAKTPPSNLVFVPGVTKPTAQHSHDNNQTSAQFGGHLAPPQTVPFPGLKQVNENANSKKSRNDDNGHPHGDQNKDQHNDHHDMFHMDME